MMQMHLAAARVALGLALVLPMLAQSAEQVVTRIDGPAGTQIVATPVPVRASSDLQHTAIPYKQEKQATDTLAYQSFAALVLVGLAAYGIIFGLKRFGGAGNVGGHVAGGLTGKWRRARMIEATRLGRKSMLYVVEYQGQELLLAEGEHGIELLVTGPLSMHPAAAGQASDKGVTDA